MDYRHATVKGQFRGNAHTLRSWSINFSSSSLCLVTGSAGSGAGAEDRRGEARPGKQVRWRGQLPALHLSGKFLCQYSVYYFWLTFKKYYHQGLREMAQRLRDLLIL